MRALYFVRPLYTFFPSTVFTAMLQYLLSFNCFCGNASFFPSTVFAVALSAFAGGVISPSQYFTSFYMYLFLYLPYLTNCRDTFFSSAIILYLHCNATFSTPKGLHIFEVAIPHVRYYRFSFSHPIFLRYL